ncbi:glycoside hydrolase family 16 protein [Paludibacter sp.]
MRTVFLFVSFVIPMFISCQQDGYQKMIEDALNEAMKEVPEKQVEWKLVWKQNFDLVGIMDDLNSYDPSAWSKITRGSSDWNAHMTSFDSCYDFRNGNLVLRGIKNTTQVNDPSKYLTGGLHTKGKKSFGLGRIEIRAKLQAGQGAWPAIWMMPESPLLWPLGGEIDIMERINYESRVQQTVHTYYTKTIGNTTDPVHKNIFYNLTLPNTYNTYAVERYQDSLVFYVNHNRTFSYPRVKDLDPSMMQFPFSDHEFYLILSMQLGGSWTGKIEDADLPNEIHIDWVRFYELKEED